MAGRIFRQRGYKAVYSARIPDHVEPPGQGHVGFFIGMFQDVGIKRGTMGPESLAVPDQASQLSQRLRQRDAIVFTKRFLLCGRGLRGPPGYGIILHPPIGLAAGVDPCVVALIVIETVWIYRIKTLRGHGEYAGI